MEAVLHVASGVVGADVVPRGPTRDRGAHKVLLAPVRVHVDVEEPSWCCSPAPQTRCSCPLVTSTRLTLARSPCTRVSVCQGSESLGGQTRNRSLSGDPQHRALHQ
jgi:hypothetical protein